MEILLKFSNMKQLTIKNIERLKGAGTNDSPVVLTIDTTPEQYQMTMDWEGYLWNVVLSRRSSEGGYWNGGYWNMAVQRHGKMDIQDTAMSKNGLSTPHQFMLVVETLMSRTRL